MSEEATVREWIREEVQRQVKIFMNLPEYKDLSPKTQQAVKEEIVKEVTKEVKPYGFCSKCGYVWYEKDKFEKENCPKCNSNEGTVCPD